MRSKNKKFLKGNLRNYQIILLSGIVCITFSCNYNNSIKSGEQIINEYYSGLNSNDFHQIKQYISDSILITEGDFIVTKNIEDYYVQLQWDSVFSPKYELIDLQSKENRFTATVNKSCKRIEFLQDTLITLAVDIYVNNGKISKFQTIDYLVFDFEKWQSRRDSLNEWIEKYHPELSGCITNMTPMGAVDYLKAIELYSRNK